MKASSNGVALIHHFEGCHLESYVIPGESWATIGWGHAIPLVQHPRTITLAQADAFFAEDLAKRETRLAQLVHVTLNQNQIDAALSFFLQCNPEGFRGFDVLASSQRRQVLASSCTAAPLGSRWTRRSHGRFGASS